MKLERAVLREVRLALQEPFEASHGSVRERRTLLLTLYAEGLEGWGECVALPEPTYTAETVDTAWDALTETLLPTAIGRDAGAPLVASGGTSSAHPMARAALEMASWDVVARARGVSIATILGGGRPRVPVGISLGFAPSLDALAERVERALADGYARVKLKIAPGWDAEPLAFLRARFPEAVLSADANGAYAASDSDRLQELDALDLQLLEQPLPAHDLAGHARLQERLSTPICLDESVGSVAEAARALELRACRVLNLKPGRVGGYAASLRIHDDMRAAGVPVWCGGMLETGVGRAHNLALASLPGFTLPGDISASRRYWARDIVSPEHEVEDGFMRVPSGPGIGVEVDVERVEALTARVATFG